MPPWRIAVSAPSPPGALTAVLAALEGAAVAESTTRAVRRAYVGGITVVTAAGLFGAVQGLTPAATADPASSPGVPCLGIVQLVAASPGEAQQSLQTAATALVDSAVQPAAPVFAAASPVAAPAPDAMPSSLTVPHDLVCEGTAWAAPTTDQNLSPATPLVTRSTNVREW